MANRIEHLRSLISLVALLALIFFMSDSQAMAEDQKMVDSSATDTSAFAALDNGVDTIDVSKYSKEMQEKYEVVKDKCAQCHSLARVINSNYALSDEWKRYIKRMRRKPGSKIKKSQAKEIWEFLVYDSKERKADLIKQKNAKADSASQSK